MKRGSHVGVVSHFLAYASKLGAAAFPAEKASMANNHSDSDTLKRPVVVSILSILSALGLSLGFIGLVMSPFIPSLRSAYPPEMSDSYMIIVGILMPAGIGGSVGIFLMRKWGLYLYGLFTVIGYGINTAFGVNSGIGGPIFSLVFLGIVLVYFKRLR